MLLFIKCRKKKHADIRPRRFHVMTKLYSKNMLNGESLITVYIHLVLKVYLTIIDCSLLISCVQRYRYTYLIRLGTPYAKWTVGDENN